MWSKIHIIPSCLFNSSYTPQQIHFPRKFWGALAGDWCRQLVKNVLTERWANCWTDNVAQLHLSRVSEWLIDPIVTQDCDFCSLSELAGVTFLYVCRIAEEKICVLLIWSGYGSQSRKIAYANHSLVQFFFCIKWNSPFELSIYTQFINCRMHSCKENILLPLTPLKGETGF